MYVHCEEKQHYRKQRRMTTQNLKRKEQSTGKIYNKLKKAHGRSSVKTLKIPTVRLKRLPFKIFTDKKYMHSKHLNKIYKQDKIYFKKLLNQYLANLKINKFQK